MKGRGKIVRQLRVQRGMKQSYLAELMGVDQATISRWERGDLVLRDTELRRIQALLRVPPDPAEDVALKRLIEGSARKVHLICDRTHRLLAASPARQTEWREPAANYVGSSLFAFASLEIIAAEDRLVELGWHAGETTSLEIATGPNRDPDFRILPGRVLWERIHLSDGSPARIVTTLS